MTIYTEKLTVPYSSDQMHDLVMDIEKYPEFLPWCLDCRILNRKDGYLYANLVIGYKLIREWFMSRVRVAEDKSIYVEYVNGPLRHLRNEWKFIPHVDGSCTVDFFIDFEFKNIVFEKVMGKLFGEIARRMVSSFEKRAEQIYGPAIYRGDGNGVPLADDDNDGITGVFDDDDS